MAVRQGNRRSKYGPQLPDRQSSIRHRPASGAVFLGDENTAGMTIAQMARRVGYVFQNPGAMLFAPTLREELAFGPKNLGLPADVVEKNVLHAAQVVGLADRLAILHGGRIAREVTRAEIGPAGVYEVYAEVMAA